MLSLSSDLLILWEEMQLRIRVPDLQNVHIFSPSLFVIEKATVI